MRLATADSVLNVLGIQTSAGAMVTASAALDATFHDVQEVLETNLAYSTQTDYFDIGRYEAVNPSLRLSNSFVVSDEPIVVTVSATGLSLPADTGTVLTTADYEINFKLGTLRLRGTILAGLSVISVSYSSGFNTGADPEMLSDTPAALVQAAISKAACYAQLNPANIAKDKAKFSASVAVHALNTKGSRAIAAYVRPRGIHIWPSHTVTVE